MCAPVQVVDLTGLVLDAFGGELRSWSLKNSVTVDLPKPTNTNTSLRFSSSLRGATLGVKVRVSSQVPLASSCLVEVARLAVENEDVNGVVLFIELSGSEFCHCQSTYTHQHLPEVCL